MREETGAQSAVAVLVKQASKDELTFLASGTLVSVKDYPQQGSEYATSKRRLYFRPNADLERLIAACAQHIISNPNNVRARLIRGSSYLKKGVPR